MTSTYKKNLIEKVTNVSSWPSFKNGPFLDELNRIAEIAYNKKTVEGYLAAVLIYHQLCEELIRILIECSEFIIQIAIFPSEINFKHKKIRMLGQLIEDAENTISFKNKKKFINNYVELNKIRIEIVHKLTLKTSLSDIKIRSKKMKVVFDNIFILFEEIYDDFHLRISDYSDNINLEEFKSNE